MYETISNIKHNLIRLNMADPSKSNPNHVVENSLNKHNLPFYYMNYVTQKQKKEVYCT